MKSFLQTKRHTTQFQTKNWRQHKMIKIELTDTDIVYPIKTLAAINEAEGLSLKEKQNFIDKFCQEVKVDLEEMLFGTNSVYDDYYDGTNTEDEEDNKVA